MTDFDKEYGTFNDHAAFVLGTAGEVRRGLAGQGRAAAVEKFVRRTRGEIEELRAQIADGKPIDPDTIADAIQITEAMQALGSTARIVQENAGHWATDGEEFVLPVYRLEYPEYGALHGTANQLCRLLHALASARKERGGGGDG